MVDPLKATKGRRMSKKPRKKSPKTLSPRKAAAKSPAKAGTTRALTARKSTKKAVSGPSKPPTTPRANTRVKTTAARAESGAARPAQPSEGTTAPAFRLLRDGGGVVSLSDFSGQKLVLFFYPRANTPGCTREAMDFTRLAGAFAESGTAILGISADSPKAQEAFRDKHKLNVPLISDEKHEMLKAYGAWGEKSLYGRTFLGIIRTTVLIGADGLIKRIWRNVKVDGHADAVLAAAKATA
jgi:thioredoxin-dependent peroxiredoxin